VTLAAQRAPLENWIDAAASALVPFVIVGDWNRRMNVHGQSDHIWGEIDDGDPVGLDPWRVPFNRDSGCNAGFTEPIDFMVLDDRAWGWSTRHHLRRSSTTTATGMRIGIRPPITVPSSLRLTGRRQTDGWAHVKTRLAKRSPPGARPRRRRVGGGQCFRSTLQLASR
jgi:hypothetical protein